MLPVGNALKARRNPAGPESRGKAKKPRSKVACAAAKGFRLGAHGKLGVPSCSALCKSVGEYKAVL